MKTTHYSFKNGYDKYRRTCDIQKSIKVFDHEANIETKGLDYMIETKHTKKRHPGYSTGKAKQHALWDEGKLTTKLTCCFLIEVKLAEGIPGADSYKVKEKYSKASAYNNIHMGTDVKTCAKPIKYTPGPGYYNNDSTRGRSFNYKAQNGFKGEQD